MTSILFICHGNICRSTMAQYVMEQLVRETGLETEFRIDSAATSREEIGNDVHPGTRRKLEREGVPCGHHRARQVTRADYDSFDYLVIMDEENRRGLSRIIGDDPEGKVSKLLDWAGEGRDVADPWYTGDFDATYRDVSVGCAALLARLVCDDQAH
ncbi:low molecular weight protein-tyrosine-phosphatase [Olsenella sp. DNF00959]|uniref:low molecular weight protein-tyrosine-phosphatase n=1 Tax=Olsenella TaxID=133925 RepID=UPI00078265B9|nr:low molecular weight protein-tyrosine-phosphatase [Olsenella sp. DNF00959]KXB63039.1 low molecular weight phosphotyrosine protein phosphatase [Olsenella sp. DNF00959]